MDFEQISILDYLNGSYRITKPIRLIELFAGVGSQAMALKAIGANFEHWLAVEFDKYAIASYNAIHGTSFPVTDVTKITGKDLNIVDTDHFTYLLTYLLISLYGLICCREDGRHGKRERYKIKLTLGSRALDK